MILLSIFTFILWVIPGLDKLRTNNWYVNTDSVKRIGYITLDVIVTPLTMVIDLVKSFSK